MNEEDFDFGFTAMSQEELPVINDNLMKMHSMITSLIKSLMKSPEKEHIHWPNRIEKLKEFQTKIDELLK